MYRKTQTLKIKHSLLNSTELKAKHGLWVCLLELIIHCHRSNHISGTCVFLFSLSNIIIKKKRKSHSFAFMDVMSGQRKSFLRPQLKAGWVHQLFLCFLIMWSTVSTRPWGHDDVQNHHVTGWHGSNFPKTDTHKSKSTTKLSWQLVSTGTRWSVNATVR